MEPHKLSRIYILKQNSKELFRAATPTACLSELAVRYPTMQIKVAIKLGYSIEPFTCPGHSLDERGICSKCGWQS